MPVLSATNTELPKPVNVIFQQTFLRNAQVRAPYFIGSEPGSIQKHGGSATIGWRRIENLAASTGALSELTVNATYMQGRTAAALSVTDYLATVLKYGNFVALTEEADLLNFSTQMDKIVQVLGINAGQSLNQLQRNVVEGATATYPAGASQDSEVVSAITLNIIKNTVNTLVKNSAMTFTGIATGSQNIGTVPILPSFWLLTHPDVALDIVALTGFKSVETYAGQVSIAPGEFGFLAVAGVGVRCIQSEDATVDADDGGTKGSTGLNGTSDVDLYSSVVLGQNAVGSVGLGKQYTDGVYRAGDDLGPVEMIIKGLGSGGTSDPFNEVQTLAWKAWHTAKITNPLWIRDIRSGATDFSA